MKKGKTIPKDKASKNVGGKKCVIPQPVNLTVPQRDTHRWAPGRMMSHHGNVHFCRVHPHV
jgi:hypothetical protein